MADPAQYQGYSFRPTSALLASGQLTVQGKARWRLDPELDPAAHMIVWEQRSYKSGLTIGLDQDIVAFSYLDALNGQIVMQPAPPADVADLQTIHGVQDGYKWVAFRRPAVAEARAYAVHNDSVEFTVTLTITVPRPGRQLIGVVSRHGTGSFRDATTTALWVLPPVPFP